MRPNRKFSSRIVSLVTVAFTALVFLEIAACGQAALPSPTTVTFAAPGGTSWTVPAGVTSARVQVWGGGGSGGSATGGGSPGMEAVAGAGGGGGYSRSVLSVTPNGVYQVVVGPGGGTNTNGGFSNFGDRLVTACGGFASPGLTNSGTSGFIIAGLGGPGASANCGIGTIRFAGGHGARGEVQGTTMRSGGGGSSAGTGSNGIDGVYSAGGTAPTGGGAGGNGMMNGTAERPQPGEQPGGGGGGAVTSSVNPIAGGAGGAGKIVITYPAAFTASGRVITPTGRGIRAAVITVTGGALSDPIIVAPNRQGVYTVANLPVGSYTFTFASNRPGITFTTSVQMVSSNDADVTVADVVSN